MEENVKNKRMLYLVLGIIQMLFGMLITGILCIVFSSSAYNLYSAGNFAEADRNWKYAKICTVISFVLILLAVLIFVGFIIMGFSIFSDAVKTTTSNYHGSGQTFDYIIPGIPGIF